LFVSVLFWFLLMETPLVFGGTSFSIRRAQGRASWS